jgi:hypothetical protein
LIKEKIVKSQHFVYPLLASLLLLSTACVAGGLPEQHVAGKVTYVTGGIGKDEANALKRAAPAYPLEVMFVRKGEAGQRDYAAGDKVEIRDARGRILLNTETDGPFLLAKLPPGHYSIEASNEGMSQTRSVTVNPGRHARVIFEWQNAS